MKSKILLIIPSGKGTIAKVSFNLYQSLKQTGYDVYVLNISYEPDDEYIFEDSFNLNKKDGHNIAKKILNSFGKIKEIQRVKNIIKPEICISTLTAANTYNILTKKDDYCIGIFHAPLEQTKILSNYVYFISKISYKYLFKRFDKLIGVSEEISKDLRKYIDCDKIETIYNIHNISEIKKKSLEEIEDRYITYFENDVVLFVGSIDKNKGLSRLIYSFSLLCQKVLRPTFLIIVGGFGKNGELELNKLKQLILSLGLTDKILFLGEKSNPYKYMNRAKVFVSSSYSEGLPGVLIEALILNIPIVSTNSSIGVWEILNCYKNYDKYLNTYFESSKGIITSNNDNFFEEYSNITDDTENLYMALLKILNNKEQYQAMIESSSDFDRFSAEIVSKKILEKHEKRDV